MNRKSTLSISHMVSQKEGNIVSDMDGEKVMLSIHNGKYFNLGHMGGEIWERVKAPITIEELVRQLTTQYDVEQSACQEQVISFLDLLAAEDLVQIE
ncbi:lasso peptide biosynthesis PqqD family chaperone [Virgibacillus sp. C22-A2]|uniref:Lasso peptide biosynthesis PqqD family chaperone n=1 Tax=Virgibacillus tibetensis TaxID=3042313 RepID=A0ABU6KG00_9BACI|nr:lasso peptide biosynthesis PqqD family chaperone [Virgibacillus sp. C22-A2]